MAATRTRKSAEVRREEILAVALRHFAIGGFHGTSTEAIAREAGISQPYLFRLFRTKRELGQRLVFDVSFELDECDATITDRVEDTVDYGEVCQVIALIAQQRS